MAKFGTIFPTSKTKLGQFVQRKQTTVGCNKMDRDSVTKEEFANDDVQDTDSDELVDPISMGHLQKPI